MFYLTRKRFAIGDICLLVVLSSILGLILINTGLLHINIAEMILFVVITYSVFSIVKIVIQNLSGNLYFICQFRKTSDKIRIYSNMIPGFLDGSFVPDEFLEGTMRKLVDESDGNKFPLMGFTSKEISEAMVMLTTAIKEFELPKDSANFTDFIIITAILQSVNPKIQMKDLLLFSSWVYCTMLKNDKETFNTIQ